MKKKIVIFILFDILLYFIIFLNYSLSKQLVGIASKEFNNKYIVLYILLNTVLFIIISFIYNVIINPKDIENITDKYIIYEFIIIGINSLFMSSLYMCKLLNINFLPDWLIANPIVTSNLGSILFGFELYRLIKYYRRNV